MKARSSKLIAVTVPLLVLLLWLGVSLLTDVKEVILPPPWAVAEQLGRILASAGLWTDLGLTLHRTTLGFLVGVSTGVLLGAAMGSWPRMHNVMILPVDALRSLPATTLFPLFMLCLGWGMKSLVALVAFPCCWLVTINTMYGVRNSSKIRREMATMFRLSTAKRFFFVTLPDALPSIAASLRLSVAISLHMAIIGEMFMGTTSGLGYRILDAHLLLRVSDMYAVIIVVGVLGYLLNYALVKIEQHVFLRGRHG